VSCLFRNFFLILMGATTSFVANGANGAIRLDPQTVVDLSLSKGLRAKGADLQAQRFYVAVERARSVFDLQFKLTPSFEYTEAQTLGGFSNPIDRTFTIFSSLTKRFPSGTTLGLEYQNVRQSSVLSSFATSNRSPNANLNNIGLFIRQSFSANAFGYADRLGLEVAEESLASGLEGREENLEEILLNAMTLFWNAYVAERQLAENVAAREKYDQLVRNVRRKAGFNLSTPGELPRLEAEFEGAEQRLKVSSASYLVSLDALRTALRLDPQETIELVIPKDLPPIPRLRVKPISDLRAIRIAKKGVENFQRNRDIVFSAGRPRLDLVARAESTGVDEEQGAAISEMGSGSHPTYFVGVEFETALSSSLFRASVADAEVAVMQAENELRMKEDAIRDHLAALERTVSSQHAIASSALQTVSLRERVVREIEVSYRQGRQPLVELIRAYNDLFASQLEKARAIGQYHINLNQLAAARDELVSGAK
jgi:outer membrane protein TolC